jgi:hypothetical protein
MGFGDEFRDTYGRGTTYRARPGRAEPPRLDRSGISAGLWEADGWASYRDGLLWFVDPHDFEPVVKAWNLPEAAPLITVARAAFGELYLLGSFPASDGTSPDSVLALNPHIAQYSFVGPYAEEFLTSTIAWDRYIKTMHESDVRRARKDVGPLSWDEMYGYEPALALGGSGKPETVRRVNIFNHHLLLSQLTPVKRRDF